MLGNDSNYLRYRWAISVRINHGTCTKSGWLKRLRVTEENRVKSAFASPTQSALINWSSFGCDSGFSRFHLQLVGGHVLTVCHLLVSEVDRFLYTIYIKLPIRFRANPNFLYSAKRVSGSPRFTTQMTMNVSVWRCLYGRGVRVRIWEIIALLCEPQVKRIETKRKLSKMQ